MSPLLETRDLSVRISGQRVCDSLELRIGHGECWALLGRNGTGKTTLLHHLAGLRRDHSGDILSAGQDLAQLSARSRAQRIGTTAQQRVRRAWIALVDQFLVGVVQVPQDHRSHIR